MVIYIYNELYKLEMYRRMAWEMAKGYGKGWPNRNKVERTIISDHQLMITCNQASNDAMMEYNCTCVYCSTNPLCTIDKPVGTHVIVTRTVEHHTSGRGEYLHTQHPATAEPTVTSSSPRMRLYRDCGFTPCHQSSQRWQYQYPSACRTSSTWCTVRHMAQRLPVVTSLHQSSHRIQYR